MSERADTVNTIAATTCRYTITGMPITPIERRRPGRLEMVSPHLLHLLRRDERDWLTDAVALDDYIGDLLDDSKEPTCLPSATNGTDANRGERFPDGSGIILGLLGGSTLWAIIVAGVWAIL